MKIRIHPALYAYMISMIALSSWRTCVGALIALCVHEAGHWCVSRVFHERIDRLELTPFGGVMFYEQGKSASKGIPGICVAAAGPGANYLFLTGMSFLAEWIDAELLYSIASSSIIMFLINLLPAFPLDGGRIVFCIGYYLFPIAVLVRVLYGLGISAGAGLLCFAVYGLVSQKILNCSIFIAGIYLIYCAQRTRDQVLLENFYALIQEKEDQRQEVRKVNIYRVPTDIPILRLIPFIGKTSACEFVAKLNGHEQIISEEQICRTLLDQPFASVQEIFFQKNNG